MSPYWLLPGIAALLVGIAAGPVIARAFPIAPVFLLASLLASERFSQYSQASGTMAISATATAVRTALLCAKRC